MQRKDQVVEPSYHEKLLKDRVHIADAAEVSNTDEAITGLSLLAYLDVNDLLQIRNQGLWVFAA